MTAIESPVTITTTHREATARCECGWETTIDARRRQPRTTALGEWADHWHHEHESETTDD